MFLLNIEVQKYWKNPHQEKYEFLGQKSTTQSQSQSQIQYENIKYYFPCILNTYGI